VTENALSFVGWNERDYRSKTSHLTPYADLAYRRILGEIFVHHQDTGEIPDDDILLRQLSGFPDQWPETRHILIDGPRPVLEKTDHGTLRNSRMAEEIDKARRSRQQRIDARNAPRRKAGVDDEPDDNATAVERPSNGRGVDRSTKRVSISLSSIESLPSGIETGEPSSRARDESSVPPQLTEAAAAYRELAVAWKSPGLTDRKIQALRAKFERVLVEIVDECPGFTWAELMTRTKEQPYIRDQISSFDFEWFLKREFGGTRLNARKVWHRQFQAGAAKGLSPPSRVARSFAGNTTTRGDLK